ncbi:hypothetical protein J1614_000515 [Plenodomus biglobosus]|nr:hypothetical protein J1614_000515 [Plenodomus biglobosus]
MSSVETTNKNISGVARNAKTRLEHLELAINEFLRKIEAWNELQDSVGLLWQRIEEWKALESNVEELGREDSDRSESDVQELSREDSNQSGSHRELLAFSISFRDSAHITFQFKEDQRDVYLKHIELLQDEWDSLNKLETDVYTPPDLLKLLKLSDSIEIAGEMVGGKPKSMAEEGQ